MRTFLVAAMLAAFAFALGAGAVAAPPVAPTAVFTQTMLRGHLPDLGEAPSLRVFLSAQAYDAFHISLGEADIFPSASALGMNFDRHVLALYAKGADVAGRCLNVRGSSGVSGDVISLDLIWLQGTCGAPANAHYPFVLASLLRTANDGNVWLGTLRTICGAAPDNAASRACAPVAGAAGASPVPTAAPSAPAASALPTAAPSTQITLPAFDYMPLVSAYASAIVNSLGWLGLGLIVGVLLTALYTRRRRASRTSSLELTHIGGGESVLSPNPPVESA